MNIQFIITGITILLCFAVREPQIICWILAAGMGLLLAVSFFSYKRRERKVEEMVTYLMKVQDHLEMPEMAHIQEGQLGILQSEIYKLVAILGEQYANERKTKTYLADMMSDISHQIKTPIAAITIMSDLLKQEDLSEEQRLDYVAKIDKQINRITWLVRNLLTLSQLEADMLELKREEVNVMGLLEEVLEPFEIMAEVKNVELQLHGDANIQMVCDRHWTGEAISNIVKNCIEHTKEGGKVTLDVSQNSFSTNLLIRDTGEGIAKEELPYIFKRFYKTANGDKSSVGIGLSMSKQIISKQNGTIDVHSVLGEGTEFLIKIYI